MALIYSQSWSAGASANAMRVGFYRSSNNGGSDPPDTIYPEIAISEASDVTTATGPSGENCLDYHIDPAWTGIFPHNEDYQTSGLALKGIGPLSSPSYDGWWNAQEGRVTWKQYFSTAAWHDAPANRGDWVYIPLYIASGIFDSQSGIDTYAYANGSSAGDNATNVKLGLRWRNASGGLFPGTRTSLSEYTALRAGTVGGRAIENAWQDFDLRWKCGTVTNVVGPVVSSDGWIEWRWNDVIVLSVYNIPLCVNRGTDFTAGDVSVGIQNGSPAQINWLNAIWLGLYGLFGPVTAINVYDEVPVSPCLPVGTLMISSYGDFPARFYSPTGADLGQPATQPVQCGSGCDGIVALSTGEVGVIGGNAPTFPLTGVGTFNTDFSKRADGADAGSVPHQAGNSSASDEIGGFYGVSQDKIFRYDRDGNLTNTWTVAIPGFIGSTQLRGIAVNAAGTDAYLAIVDTGVGGRPKTVWSWDLAGAGALIGVFSSHAGGYQILTSNGLVCLIDGTVVIGWDNTVGGAPGFLEVLDASGGVLATYTLGSGNSSPLQLAKAADATTFWFNWYDPTTTTFSSVRFQEIVVATGLPVAGHDFVPESGVFEFDSPFTVLRAQVGACTSGGCQGGGAITVVADPPDGPAFFSGRTNEARAWVTIEFDDGPRSFALDTRNDPGDRKRGNVLSFGIITRQLSGRDSPYKMGTATVDIDDSDRFFSVLEAAIASGQWQNREATFYLSTKDAIEAGDDPHVRFRGLWTAYQSSGLKLSLTFSSILGSEFSLFNLDRMLPTRKIKDDFPDALTDSLEQYVPIGYGIFPDSASPDADAVENVLVTPIAKPAAPTNFVVTLQAGGNRYFGTPVYYCITAMVGGVESEPSPILSVVTDATNQSALLGWDAYPAATAINVYTAVSPEFRQFARLATALAGGATSYLDEWVLPNQDTNWLLGTPWTLGLRMNVTYQVYAQLSDGTFSRPGQAVSTTQLLGMRAADNISLLWTPINGTVLTSDAALVWDAFTDAVKYYVFRQVSFYSSWGQRYDLMATVNAPTAAWTDVGNDDALIPGGYADAPGVALPGSAALVPQITGTVPAIPAGKETIGSIVYNRLVLFGHAIRDIEQIFFSLSTQGTGNAQPNTLTYQRVADADYGVTWLAQGKAGWPFANDYVSYGGHWYTVIFTTMDPLPDQILVDCCAIEDVGDATGSTIDAAARQCFHLLNNFGMSDGEWTNGAWLAARTFTGGVPVVNSQSIQDLEDLQVLRMGRYYRGQIYLDTPVSLRTILGRCFDSWGTRFGENEHGQVIGKDLDEFTDLLAAIHLKDVRDLIDDTAIARQLTEMENTILYDFGYRSALGEQFLYRNQSQRDAVAIGTLTPPTGNRGRAAVGDKKQMFYVDDPTTASDVVGRQLGYGKYPPRYVTIVCTLEAVAVKLGSIVVVDDYQGIGAQGWTGRPLWVLGIEDHYGDLQTAPTIKLACVDVIRFLNSFGLWADDTVPVWASASEDERATYLFWTRDDDTMTGGLPGKAWA